MYWKLRLSFFLWVPSVAYSVCLTSCAFSCAWSNLPLFEQQVLRVSLSLYWFFSMFARLLSVCRLHLLSSMIIKFVVCCWIVSCRKDEGSCTVAAAFSCVCSKDLQRSVCSCCLFPFHALIFLWFGVQCLICIEKALRSLFKLPKGLCIVSSSY